jgi:hypothetical protein
MPPPTSHSNLPACPLLSAMLHLDAMNIESPDQNSGVSLTNSQAKPVAERIYLELAKEFHPTAIIKIMANLNRSHGKHMRRLAIEHQANITERRL